MDDTNSIGSTPPEDNEEPNTDTPAENVSRNSIHVPVMVKVDARLVKTASCERYDVYRSDEIVGTVIKLSDECYLALQLADESAAVAETIEEAVESIVAG